MQMSDGVMRRLPVGMQSYLLPDTQGYSGFAQTATTRN